MLSIGDSLALPSDDDQRIVDLIELSSENRIDSLTAFNYANEALILAKKKADDKAIGDAYYNIGDHLKKYDRHYDAIKFYRQASTHYKKAKAFEKVVKVYRKVGRIYYEFADYSTALDYYMKGLDINEYIQKEDTEKGWLYRYIGSVYKRQKKYKKALDYYEKSIQIFEKIEDNDGLASAYNNIGNVYGRMNDMEQQLFYYEKALKIAKNNNLLWRGSIIIDNIGSVYNDKGDLDKAIEYYLQGYEYLTTEQDTDHSFLALNMANTAEVYRELEDYGKSKMLLLEAERHAGLTPVKKKLRLQLIYKNMSLLYEDLGQEGRALAYYKLYKNYSDSLVSSEISSEVSKIDFLHQKKKDAQQIHHLETEQKLKDEKIKKQYGLVLFLLIGFIGVLVFTTIIFFQKKNLLSAYDQLVSKNIEVVEAERNNPASIYNKGNKEEIKEGKYSGSALTEEQMDALYAKIIDQFEQEKIFKEDLTVIKLADKLDTNKSYISQIINQKTGKNFSTFINEYRIKEARQMMANPEYQYYTIEAIANSTGFNSVSAFNNAFKKFTGIPPSYFLKSLKNKQKG